MPIIAIANQKGGVGKTSVAVHLAAYLARAGRSAVLVDADPQGNATSWALDADTSQTGMYELLTGSRPALELVQDLPRWGFRLLGGNQQTGTAYSELPTTLHQFGAFAKALRPLADAADFTLLDMPPSKSTGFRQLLFAADLVLIPTQLERLSLEGVAFIARTCGDLRKEFRRGPRLLGIVPNMTRARTLEHQHHMAQLLETYGPSVWPPIPLSVKVAEACSYGTTVFEYASRSDAASALETIGERVLLNVEK